MQSWFVAFANLLLIGSAWNVVWGYPFSFLPRSAHERIAEQRSVDRQMIVQTNSLLSPLDYGVQSADASVPVQPWTKITQNPVNGLEITAGAKVQLECKASGSPPPEILWFTGSGSIDQLTDYVRASTQDIYDPSEEWKGIGRVISRLVIECATPEDAGLIYCASISARKIQISTPTVLIVNGNHAAANCSTESDPTITLYSPTRVANIGSTVILPCRASGRPEPQISWVDNYNTPLGLSSNSRHRVLDNGDLLIEQLLWEDMGGYTCRAKSGHQQEAVDTFLYPLRPEKEQDRTVN